MEEIITVDGRQFKLSTDRPLTAEQKEQTVAEIRKQTGCGTCGPRIANMGNDWQYGGVRSLSATCTRTNVSSNTAVTLLANPDTGTAPYIVRFLGQFGGSAPALLAAGTAPYGLTGTNPYTVAVDSGTATVTYQVTDAQIISSAAGPLTVANVDTSGIGVPAGATGTVRFLVHTEDACPTGHLHCIEYCDLGIVCPTPICNFIVT